MKNRVEFFLQATDCREGKKIAGEVETKATDDRSSWAIGGTTLVGIGVGLIFVQTSGILFVACILIGLGAGLVITPFISKQ